MIIHRQLCYLILFGSAMASAQHNPPTLDPTYGRPIPKADAKTKKAPDATWIWAAKTSDNQTIYARRAFKLAKVPARAMLYVTADNSFVAYVNGQKATATPNDPGDRELWKKVQSVDVTSLLQKGQNAIAIQAHNDGDAAGLVVRLEIDGRPAVLTDKTWKVSTEEPDATWVKPNFSDDNWHPATEEGRVGGSNWGTNLQAWPVSLDEVPPYLFHMPISPTRWAYEGDPDGLIWHNATSNITINRPTGTNSASNWKVIFDFGKELTGRVLNESPTPGLTIGTGESAGEALAKPWVTASGNATEYTALRFATITVPAQQERVSLNLTLDHLYYPVQYRGRFDCSDPLLTQVWYTGAYTAHSCMQQDIWDAPKRDRWVWMGDLHVTGEVINNVFADQFLMEQTIQKLRDGAQGGRPANELPKSHVNGIPGYSYSWIAGLADLYRHIDNKTYLKTQHQALLSMLEFCQQDVDEKDLFANKHGSWVYTDWSPGFGKDTPLSRTATHLFLVRAVKEAVFLLKELADEPNAAKYAAWDKRLTLAAQKYLLTEQGIFSERKQPNAMAILSGVATPDQAGKMFQQGIFAPDTKPTEFIVSPYYGNYVLQAMSGAGHTQEGLDYVRSFWGQMVKDGATTFYETYGPDWNKKNFHAHLQWDEHDNDAAGYHVSLCHGWSAGATTFLTECVLGVQPTGAGFKTCTIAPRLGDLKWAAGTIPTPHGDITLRIDRQDSKLVVKLKVPKGVTATVSLPSSVTSIDGMPVNGSSLQVGPGQQTIIGS